MRDAPRELTIPGDGVRLFGRWSEVARLARPLLLLQGAHDRLQPPAQALLLFEAAHEPKDCVSLPTGHLPNLERPDLLADVATAWLAKLRPGP
jgi:pimeloyl-ACP methyl ester carboxylesterase